MNERPKGSKAFMLVEPLAVVLMGLLLVAILLPVLAHAREAARSVACANNERSLGLAIFQYAERYGNTMPTAYENLWNRLGPFQGEGGMPPKQPTGSKVFRCPSDRFITEQKPWGKKNQCSYAPNADETGAGTLKPEEEAGWYLTVAGQRFGVQYSPFTAKFRGHRKDEQALVKLSSVAVDTVLVAECWRAKTQNSLFLDKPRMRMRETKGVPRVGSRNSLLLKQYTSARGVTVSRKSGDLADAGPFSFLLDFAALGCDTAPVRLENTYHVGRINVLYADGHVEAIRVKAMALGPGQGRWAKMKTVAEIPYWNRRED